MGSDSLRARKYYFHFGMFLIYLIMLIGQYNQHVWACHVLLSPSRSNSPPYATSWESHSVYPHPWPGWPSSLTHWGWDKMAAIFQTIFKCIFFNEDTWISIEISLILEVQLTIFQHWFRWWLGAIKVASHYLNQWRLDYWRIYICVTRHQWVNSLACGKCGSNPKLVIS